MTTTTHVDQVQTTAGENAVTSSLPRDWVDFYFKCAVLVIGLIGTAANALILYALLASGQHKKQLLICNQNVLDLCSCLLLVISYSTKLGGIGGIHLTGTTGYWLCILLISDSLLWCSLYGSIINLAGITVDRYLKVVHPVCSKRWRRKWMIYSAMAFAYIAAIIYNMPLVFQTTAVIDGFCHGYAFWESRVTEIAVSVTEFLSFFVVVLCIFIFCYGRMLMIIRRRANAMSGHAAAQGSSAAQGQSGQMQSNVIKTMLLVSGFFVISWLPAFVFYLIVRTTDVRPPVAVSYSAVFISFLYVCANPFIYAVKFQPARRVLLDLIPCKKTSVQPDSVNAIEVTNVRGIAAQERN